MEDRAEVGREGGGGEGGRGGRGGGRRIPTASNDEEGPWVFLGVWLAHACHSLGV